MMRGAGGHLAKVVGAVLGLLMMVLGKNLYKPLLFYLPAMLVGCAAIHPWVNKLEALGVQQVCPLPHPLSHTHISDGSCGPPQALCRSLFLREMGGGGGCRRRGFRAFRLADALLRIRVRGRTGILPLNPIIIPGVDSRGGGDSRPASRGATKTHPGVAPRDAPRFLSLYRRAALDALPQ